MEAMKAGLDRAAVSRISAAMATLFPSFPRQRFSRAANQGLGELELKQRVYFLIDLLHQHLPTDFAELAERLHSLPDVWDYGDENDSKRGFASWPIIDYIGVHGIEQPDIALPLLARLTHLFTAEFAIRPFILKQPEPTWDYLRNWLSHKDEHVRRLVSEGTRPRLPWGMQLQPFIADPRPLLPLLRQLHADPSAYVRRSVANNLNDIAKDHPDTVIQECRRFKAHASPHSDWVVKHACRTLVKQGHPAVFELLGFDSKARLDKCTLSIKNASIAVGENLTFTFSAVARAPRQHFVLDYAIYFLRANGTHNKKVFKLKNLSLDKGERACISKAHCFKPISTRRYYPGRHRLAIQINGQEILTKDFTLRAPSTCTKNKA